MGHFFINESEDGVLSADSPMSNDGDNFGGSSNGEIVLKKGPWTSAEDAILVDYVKKHGEGNWNAVQKHTGLLRCGKSCRLRWANHLRPNLKKGAFTSEEERLIIELHAKMGNKWARMAAHLPGRTDNEIKNYWNTRIKRRQRAGLPLYPPELCIQALPGNLQSLNTPGMCGGDAGCQDVLQNDGYKTSDFLFDSLNTFPHESEFPHMPTSGSLVNGFGCSQFYSFVPQSMGLQKCNQDPDEVMSEYGGGASDEVPSFDRACNDNYENKMSQPLGLCFPHGPDHTEKLLPLGIDQDSQFMPNGSFSASKRVAGAEKFELPSLQYQETGLGFWDPAPEPLDCFIKSSAYRTLPPDCPSPRSSGLLEALLYEAKVPSKSENQIGDYDPSTGNAGSLSNSFSMKTCYPDHTSTSCNALSMFDECIPTHTIGSSLEANMPARFVKSGVGDQSWIMDGELKENLNQLVCSRPDVILGSSWFETTATCSKPKATLISNNLGSELNSHTGTSTSIHGLHSWNNMPAVCQMSDRL